MTDEEPKMLEELCSSYDYIYDVIYRCGVAEEDIRDICEDVMLAAVKSMSMLRSENSLKAWLKAITRNKIASYYRQKKRAIELPNIITTVSGREIDLFDFIAGDTEVETTLQKKEERHEINILLDTLPENSRKIIWLHVWADYSLPETADILGINVNTVKSTYRRSLKKMRKSLEAASKKDDV